MPNSSCACPAYDAALLPLQRADPSKPFVIAQLGQSLDGRIATVNGASQEINGPSALDHLHRLRAHVDAVVVGVGTLICDDPQLTVRRVQGRNPARIIIDPHGRAPVTARCLHDNSSPVLFIRVATDAAESSCENVVALPLYGKRFDPHQIVAALFARGFRRLLIEGGALTVSAFLDAGALDRLHVLVAPVIIGSGTNGLNLPLVYAMSEVKRPRTTAYALEGGDVLFDCDFKSD